MSKKRALLVGLGLATALGAFACQKEAAPMMEQPSLPDPPLGQGEASAFMHEGSLYTFVDPSRDGNQLPARESERRHVCGKITYNTIGTILRSRGVDLTTGTAVASTSAALYGSGGSSLGAPNYIGRLGETDRSTTAGIVRLYDLMIAVAEELIYAGNGTGTFPPPNTAPCYSESLFNVDDTCNVRGFSCFLGVPLTAAQITQCNDAVVDLKSRPGFTPIGAKRFVAATMAAPIYLCD